MLNIMQTVERDSIYILSSYGENQGQNKMLRNTYNAVKKVVIGLVGVAVIIIGIILLPLPGPGWLVILFGLVILSTEFEWAQRLKEKLRAKLDQIVEKAKSRNDNNRKNTSAKNTDRPGNQKGKRKN